MSPFVSLRTAAVVTALLFAGHTAGMPWTPDHAQRGASLVAEMRGYRFDVMGFQRGYWDFYQGFGLTVSVSLLAFSVLMWQLATLARAAPGAARGPIATLLAAFVAFAALDGRYFFAAPLVLTIPSAALLAWAWLGSADRAA